ncbi:hypothetical protein GGTG_13013 [Gaeumannomyces tritici R3-111a-1]|uniref:Uncharacterized protein n=1 Tax=Gaeumannomyces tritici (strain R3-111a-1) TaxID=644352 RepID=J3PHN3_GAET3|nr:hypothetical protein GGTG_13013 [Gaeumannomyces tritici R3-111a-1]EJT69394.1 hypothetical protein GGTG_13013 [Gaeumannomyces tritici R3-111a-1]
MGSVDDEDESLGLSSFCQQAVAGTHACQSGGGGVSALRAPATGVTEDPYGRPHRPELRDGTDFTGILPDHAFGVNRGSFRRGWAGLADRERNHNGSGAIADNDSSAVGAGAGGLKGGGQVQCDMFDGSGDWFGAIVLSHDCITRMEGQRV